MRSFVTRAAIAPATAAGVAVLAGCGSTATATGSTTGDATKASTKQADPEPKAEAPKKPAGYVNAAALDGEWPLTVGSGVLTCDRSAVYFTAKGKRYSVNGTAEGRHEAPDIEKIWRDDPANPGLKIGIGSLIQAGLALCE